MRLGQDKRPEEAFPAFLALSKRMLGTSSSGRVNLAVIVAVQLFFQDSAGIAHGGYLLYGAGPDNPIL